MQTLIIWLKYGVSNNHIHRTPELFAALTLNFSREVIVISPRTHAQTQIMSTQSPYTPNRTFSIVALRTQ